MSTIRRSACAATLTIAAATASAGIASAPAANAAGTDIAYAQADRTQYLFTARSGGKTVGALHGGEQLTGTYYPSSSWFQITKGTNTGKWVWAPSLTPTPKPTRTNVTYYTTTSITAQGYLKADTTSAKKNVLAPVTAVTGDLYANGWFQQRSGGYTYFRNVMTRNPYTPLETRQWNNTTGYQAISPTSNIVTRYAHLNRSDVPIRTDDSLTSSVVTRVKSGTALTGRYINSHWFKITSGTHAGRYVSSGVLFTTSNQTTINGRLKQADLCEVPWAMRTEYTEYDRWMGCESLNELIKADTDLKARTGTGVRQWDSYRTYATQVWYYDLYGSPQAAKPGTSNHGLGNAIDMRYSLSKSLSWSSPTVINFTKYAAAYGWVKPNHLKKTATSYGEPWHFEFHG